MELQTEGRVHQDGVVQLGGGLGDVDGLHLLEAAQRVTLGHQLGDGALVERPRDQQDDVIDHVAVAEGTRGGEGSLEGHLCSLAGHMTTVRGYRLLFISK